MRKQGVDSYFCVYDVRVKELIWLWSAKLKKIINHRFILFLLISTHRLQFKQFNPLKI